MTDGTVAPEQIIINGKEFTPEDASQLIELGSKYRQYEKDLNTSLDRVVPEYTKATQKAARLAEVETELAKRTAELEEFQKKQNQSALPPDRDTVLENARKYGLVDKDSLKQEGYMTKAELDEYFSQKQSQQALVDNILKQANTLEKEIDGSDGRVPFNQKAVLAYASAYNISDLSKAYEEMNETANAKWKQAQIEKEARPGLTTLKGEGKKTPERVKVTDDNFSQLWDEVMGRTE